MNTPNISSFYAVMSKSKSGRLKVNILNKAKDKDTYTHTKFSMGLYHLLLTQQAHALPACLHPPPHLLTSHHSPSRGGCYTSGRSHHFTKTPRGCAHAHSQKTVLGLAASVAAILPPPVTSQPSHHTPPTFQGSGQGTSSF